MHLHCTDLFSSHCYKGRHHLKNKVLIRALPESGGGVYPCPNFLVLFFHQVISIIRAKRRFCRPEKKDQGARIGGWGGGLANSGNARIKTLFFR